MLKDIVISNSFKVDPDLKTIVEIINIDFQFKRLSKGIYLADTHGFIVKRFLQDNNVKIIEEYPNIYPCCYGVCDNYQQILDSTPDLIQDAHNYVVTLSTIERENQPQNGGWRWHKWGPYIGQQDPKHEYIYDDNHIDRVFCYHIYGVE